MNKVKFDYATELAVVESTDLNHDFGYFGRKIPKPA